MTLRRQPRKTSKKKLRGWLRLRRVPICTVPDQEKMAHLFIKEQLTTYVPGLINFGGRKLSKKLEKDLFVRKHGPSCGRNILNNKTHTGYSTYNNHLKYILRKKDWIDYFCSALVIDEQDVDSEDDRTRISDERNNVMVASLKDCVIQKFDIGSRRKATKSHRENYTEEYQTWYMSNSRSSFCMKAVAEKKMVPANRSNVSTNDAKMREFVVSENDFPAEIWKHARRIRGIVPDIYICDLPINLDLCGISPSLPDYLQHFNGVALFQPSNDKNLLKITLNPGLVAEREEKSSILPRSKNTAVAIATEPCQVYDFDAAEMVALSSVYHRNRAEVLVFLHCCIFYYHFRPLFHELLAQLVYSII
ncbi:unnamed protein product [Thelazia callipaeda]|uniref:POPLD domain-containing protein n=1 Tax=Thelazia callipaeda TaxID=103827 RepID=A0A0N5CT72_THECL|nr:unnamed protein product [Thelazia callipaeda]